MYEVRSHYVRQLGHVTDARKKDEGYLWVTTYKTKKEADQAAEKLRRESTAVKIEVIKL